MKKVLTVLLAVASLCSVAYASGASRVRQNIAEAEQSQARQSKAEAKQNRPLEAELQRLDRTLETADSYVSTHEAATQTIKSLLEAHADSPEEAFDLYGRLFKQEFSYSFDAAKDALDHKIEAAKALRDPVRTAWTQVDEAMLYCVAGMYLEAAQTASQIDTTLLEGSHLADYYNLRQRFSYDFREYTRSEEDLTAILSKVRHYRTKLVESSAPNSPMHTLMQVRLLIDEGRLEEADSLSLNALAAMDEGSHEFAELAYYEGTVCRDLGRWEDMMCWFARSAMGDIRSATKDNASLQTLAVELLGAGSDVERAFRYTQASLSDALFFNARLRPWQIAQSLPSISSAYNSARERQEQRTRTLVVVLLCLAALMLAATVLLLVQFARQKRTQRELAAMNLRLQETMKDLSKANSAKEEYLGLFLTMCSSYIDKLKKFIPMSQVDEELRNFYKSFDNAFLQLYPDFVERFNALLQPEARIELKKDELLNTELRIFALIKLGITQSSHIATLLRYSVNTIYNYRAQVKNASLDGKMNFEERVKAL